jgi:hypothetical protein
MAKKKRVAVRKVSAVPVKDNQDKSIQIVGLILNILILPGLGTIIGGGAKHRNTGITQLVLALVSLPLMLILIGIPLFIGVWIWGIVTGIKMVQE